MTEQNQNDSIRDAIDSAKAVTDTYTKVFLLIQQQAAERAAETVEQAAREHQQELARIRLEAVAGQLAYAAATFDRMYLMVASAPAVLRPGLLGLARKAALDLVAASVEAGGEEEAIRLVLDTAIQEVPALEYSEDTTVYKREGRRFVPVNGQAN